MKNCLNILAILIIFIAGFGFTQTCYGQETILRNQTAFLEKVFQGKPLSPEYIWITPAVKDAIEAILLHDYRGLRIKYWQHNKETVWILNDMAMEKPVYAGIVIHEQKIRTLEVLYADGRWGSQVQNTYFTQQFENVSSDANGILAKHIDGISGATFSVNAVSRLARLALALDRLKPDQ